MDRIYGTLYSYCKTSQLSHTDGGDTWSNLFGISLKHKYPADVSVPPPKKKTKSSISRALTTKKPVWKHYYSNNFFQ